MTAGRKQTLFDKAARLKWDDENYYYGYECPECGEANVTLSCVDWFVPNGRLGMIPCAGCGYRLTVRYPSGVLKRALNVCEVSCVSKR